MGLRARSAWGLLDVLGLGYDLPVGESVYAIDGFPDDDRLWRIEWIGGVGYNTSVPSEPQIDVSLAQLPKGEKNPLSARARSSQVEKRMVKIGVGLLPYIWIGSVWQKRRPVMTNLAAYRSRVSIDTTSFRMVSLDMAANRDNVIPRSSYLFGASWPHVCRTLLAAVEQNGDPYAVMVPTAEIIRFYYGPSTRLAQALFWGEYHNMFNADRSGIFEGGVVRVHLRRWLEDEDAWTLARYICSPLMQGEVSELYRNLQVYQINSASLIPQPDQVLRCSFPFAGPTTLQGVFLRLPGAMPEGPPRWLVLRIERCSAPFPFDQVIVDRDNSSARGSNVEDENLIPAWAKPEKPESEVEEQTPEVFCSNEEPRRGLEPLRIDLIEDRFEYLSGKALVKEEKALQHYRHIPMKADADQMLTGLGTGQGTWGTSNLLLTKLTTVPKLAPKHRDGPVLPANMETFVQAIELLAQQRSCGVGLIGVGRGDMSFGRHTLASFPTHDPRKGKRIAWAWIKREKRPRQVAIAEVHLEDKFAYALEIERTNQEHAILVLARVDCQRIGADVLQAILLLCALRRGWVLEDQLPEYRRMTTTHRDLVSIAVLESRIWRKITEILNSGAPQPETGRCFRADGGV
jgi:hypothetical protein